MIETVSLQKLHLSDINVRKTERDADIASLANDIEARGLKQNLVVIPNEEKSGHFEVVAGGRRLQALMLLADRKAIAKSHPVPVLIETRDSAEETSLSENLHRVAMNPADECDAFASIIGNYESDGMSDPTERIANCAKRFGVTARHVEQRLRLADLANEIFDALRHGQISLEAAKAYATYPDLDLQMKVFDAEEKRPFGKHEARSIRDAMKTKVYALTDRKALYIGIDAYHAAGGRIGRELFMGAEDRDVLLDPAIIDRLAKKKAMAEADARGKQLGCAGGVFAERHSYGYLQFPKEPKGFSKAGVGRDIDDLDASTLRTVLAIYTIAEDGSALVREDYYFEPNKPAARVNPDADAQSAEDAASSRLDHKIELYAARLAALDLLPVEIRDHAQIPGGMANTYGYTAPYSHDENGQLLVAVYIRVLPAAIDAQRTAARTAILPPKESAQSTEARAIKELAA